MTLVEAHGDAGGDHLALRWEREKGVEQPGLWLRFENGHVPQ